MKRKTAILCLSASILLSGGLAACGGNNGHLTPASSSEVVEVKAKYSVTVEADEGFAVEAPLKAEEGELVHFTLRFDKTHYAVKSLTVNGLSPMEEGEGAYAFLMPKKNALIKVEGEPASYTVENQTGIDGIIVSGLGVYQAGEKVNLSYAIAAGSGVSVTGAPSVYTLDSDGEKVATLAVVEETDGSFTFEMPYANVGIQFPSEARSYKFGYADGKTANFSAFYRMKVDENGELVKGARFYNGDYCAPGDKVWVEMRDSNGLLAKGATEVGTGTVHEIESRKAENVPVGDYTIRVAVADSLKGKVSVKDASEVDLLAKTTGINKDAAVSFTVSDPDDAIYVYATMGGSEILSSASTHNDEMGYYNDVTYASAEGAGATGNIVIKIGATEAEAKGLANPTDDLHFVMEMPAEDVVLDPFGDINYKNLTIGGTAEHLTVTPYRKAGDGAMVAMEEVSSTDGSHVYRFIPDETLYLKVESSDPDTYSLSALDYSYTSERGHNYTGSLKDKVDDEGYYYFNTMPLTDDFTITVAERFANMYKDYLFCGTFYGGEVHNYSSAGTVKKTALDTAFPVSGRYNHILTINGDGDLADAKSGGSATTVTGAALSHGADKNSGVVTFGGANPFVYGSNLIVSNFNLTKLGTNDNCVAFRLAEGTQASQYTYTENTISLADSHMAQIFEVFDSSGAVYAAGVYNVKKSWSADDSWIAHVNQVTLSSSVDGKTPCVTDMAAKETITFTENGVEAATLTYDGSKYTYTEVSSANAVLGTEK